MVIDQSWYEMILNHECNNFDKIIPKICIFDEN